MISERAVNSIKNAISVDVEDYYHVAALSKVIARDQWNSMESRVESSTHRLLDLFDTKNVKGTFFILGMVAEHDPELISEIARRGHEIACHGYSHQLIYTQTQKVFREETLRAKSMLEDIVQAPVIGYRAASYSITQESLWALDILAEAGFTYDSSIFPVRHDRYGIPDAEERPHVLKTPSGYTLTEFPLSTYKILNYKLPVAGGGYFRLFPYALTQFAFRRINAAGKSAVFYLHPWEVDPDQPRFNASLLSRFRHYNNLDKCEQRLSRLINDFQFTTLRNVLEDLNLLPDVQSAAA